MSEPEKTKIDSPIKILIYLYSVVAGLASVTAVKFLVNPEPNVVRYPSSIPLIDLFAFFIFFCYLIPFYQGAITYLNNAYTEEFEKKKGEILVDFLHLLGESMVFYAMSASLSRIFLFVSWLAVLIIIDTIWISTIKLRKIRGVPDLWVYLNLFTLLILLFFWIFYSTYPELANSMIGYTILLFYSLIRTIFDYTRAKLPSGEDFY